MLEKRNFYINGSWVAPKKPSDIEVINPASEKACAVISLGSKDDINDAVLSAKEAFKTWGYSTREDRIALLETFYTLYKKRWNDITDAIIQEMGAPKDFASKLQTGTGASHTKSFIRYLKEFEFEKPLGEHAKNQRLIYEPKGVCALITPWNWPMNQVTLKVIPALASGCTMILKPSELAPLSAMILAELIDEAKFPKGVFNLVNGDGATTGDALTSHPDINMISFTGSTRAGALISQNAAKDFKRVSLELGGKGANIIFKDADPEAIERGALRCFRNSGQSCNAPTRMLVEKSMYDEAIERLKKYTNEFKVDDPKKEGEHIGPVISETQFNKIQTLIQKGIDEGAKLLSGGVSSNSQKGFYAKPTLFDGLKENMTIAQEEIFGPVLGVLTVKNDEEALKVASNSKYGLHASVFTQDINRAFHLAKSLPCGTVSVNTFSEGDIKTPFGGYKQSGSLSRDQGTEALNSFLQTKTIWISHT